MRGRIGADFSRRAGNPRDDTERAMNHYNIPKEEYLRCPKCYPLPDRGTGLYRNR